LTIDQFIKNEHQSAFQAKNKVYVSQN